MGGYHQIDIFTQERIAAKQKIDINKKTAKVNSKCQCQ